MRARFSPRKQRGVGFALSSIPMNVVMPIAALAAAYIADTFGLYYIFMITVVVYFIGLAIFQLGVRVED